MARKKKQNCKGCDWCCDNVVLRRYASNKHDADPDKLPTGALIYIEGMWWKKKSDGRWRCKAFDVKEKTCRIYDCRPPICRKFKCTSAKKGRPARMPDNNYSLHTTNYRIILFTKKAIG